MDGLRAKLGELGGDLLKDLRDRRLLPIVAVLLVAIVAVPLLLGGGGEEAPPPAPLAEVPEGTEELEAVVTAGSAGVRDFHRRLEGRPRNPFEQQNPRASRGQGDGGDGSGSQDEGSASGEAASSGSSVSAPSGVADPPDTSTGTGTPAPPDDEVDGPRRITRLVKMTIDVRLFHAGKSRDIKGVEGLSPVPGAKTPLMRFLGATQDAKRASFVVSPAVVSTEGDGNCDPGRNDCQFLILEPGESQYFHYGEKQKRYRLKLLAIHRELVGEPGAKGGEGEDGPVAAEVG